MSALNDAIMYIDEKLIDINYRLRFILDNMAKLEMRIKELEKKVSE